VHYRWLKNVLSRFFFSSQSWLISFVRKSVTLQFCLTASIFASVDFLPWGLLTKLKIFLNARLRFPWYSINHKYRLISTGLSYFDSHCCTKKPFRINCLIFKRVRTVRQAWTVYKTASFWVSSCCTDNLVVTVAAWTHLVLIITFHNIPLISSWFVHAAFLQRWRSWCKWKNANLFQLDMVNQTFCLNASEIAIITTFQQYLYDIRSLKKRWVDEKLKTSRSWTRTRKKFMKRVKFGKKVQKSSNIESIRNIWFRSRALSTPRFPLPSRSNIRSGLTCWNWNYQTVCIVNINVSRKKA